MRGQVVEHPLALVRFQRVHFLFGDHPFQNFVPGLPVKPLLLDDGQRMAGLADVEDIFPAGPFGQALPFVFGLR